MLGSASPTVYFIVTVASVIGIAAAYLLYRTSLIKQEVILSEAPAPTQVPTASGDRSLKEKIRQATSSAQDPAAVEKISKIVEEQAQAMVKDIRQEYSVKYQVAIQEKGREIEQIKTKFQDVEKKFEESEKRYQEVDSQKRQTEAVVKSIAEGLVIVNNKGEVLLLNPSAEKLLGVDRSKKIGKPIMEDLPDELLISLSRDTTEPGEKTIEIHSKDENVKKILRSSSAVIQNENGQTVGMLNILTDVTKQRELDDTKKHFISNITHEFRTPIVAMQKAMVIIQSQQGGPLTEVQTNFLNIVSRNLMHLSRLVEDILDIAKIDSGKLVLRFVPVRLDKLLQDTCDSLETWAKSKNLDLVREIDKSVPEIQCDPDKMTQVFNNLIGNAIKFTPSGGRITVRLGWKSTEDRARVSVSDTGVGISKENLNKLFRRFEQFGDQEGILGTGLGLSITKDFVERHGGEMSVESELKKGSTFGFTLPFKQKRSQSS